MSGIAWFGGGLELLEKGGVVIYILLALSIVGLAIILIKAYHFTRARLRRLGFVDEAVAELKSGRVAQARSVVEGRPHPVARVMRKAIDTGLDTRLADRDRDAEIGRVGSGEIRKLESHLGTLEVIANLSPLLGLLGTVLGMITAFAELEQAGSEVDPTILAGGIWEALLTTAFGLAIAIPALGAFYFLEGEVEKVRTAMKDCVARVNAALARKSAEDAP